MAPPVGSTLYSEVGENKLSLDGRAEDDLNDFLIKLVYVGNLGSNTSNHLQFRFPYSDYKSGLKKIPMKKMILPDWLKEK